MNTNKDNNRATITPLYACIEHERLGYKVLEDKIIKCADCNKKLVDIIKVQENDNIVKHIKVCCPCGGESFIYKVSGVTYIQAVDGLTITDIPTELNDNIMHMIVKVKQ